MTQETDFGSVTIELSTRKVAAPPWLRARETVLAAGEHSGPNFLSATARGHTARCSDALLKKKGAFVFLPCIGL